ncbi:hypothetical protein Trydic_g10423 [Trypoxylus dichotomus]
MVIHEGNQTIDNIWLGDMVDDDIPGGGNKAAKWHTKTTVCVSAGAMETTPTTALEIVLNLEPLHIYIQRKIRLQVNEWSGSYNQIAWCRSPKTELKVGPITGRPGDAKYSFDKNYKPVIPDIEEGKKGLPVKAESIWYAYRLKTKTRVSAGIWGN